MENKLKQKKKNKQTNEPTKNKQTCGATRILHNSNKKKIAELLIYRAFMHWQTKITMITKNDKLKT